jgi:predicted AAA+ superfamily ATPase
LLQLADDLLSGGWSPASLSYFDFSDDRLIEEISAREIVDLTPVGLSSERPRIFLLDEISKATKWATWLKQAVDQGRDQFIVTA